MVDTPGNITEPSKLSIKDSIAIFFTVFLGIILSVAFDGICQLNGKPECFIIAIIVITHFIRIAHSMIIMNIDPRFDLEIYQHEQFGLGSCAMHFFLQLFLLIFLYFYIRCMFAIDVKNKGIIWGLLLFFGIFLFLYLVWDILVIKTFSDIKDKKFFEVLKKDNNHKEQKKNHGQKYNVKILLRTWFFEDIVLFFLTIIIGLIGFVIYKLNPGNIELDKMINWVLLIIFIIITLCTIIYEYRVNRDFYFGKR